MEFRAVFGQTYSQRYRFFQALLDAGAGTAFEAALIAVERIDAPERFKPDQELMVRTLTEQVDTDHEVRGAAEEEDLAAFTVANARLGALAFFMATQLAEPVCRATGPEDIPFSLCSSNEQVPGGEYGAELKIALDRFAAGFFARIINFGPVYETADIIATEAVMLPERADLVSNLLVEMNGMKPTPGLANDHSDLIAYFEGLSETVKARGEALDSQDLTTYRNVAGDRRAPYCGARSNLSSDMAIIAATFFVDLLGSCRFTATISPEDIEDLEVDPAELAIYVDAVTPAFSEALQERQSFNAELSPPGAGSTVDDTLAWFLRATALQQQLADTLSKVEPPAAMDSLHEAAVEAPLELAAFGSRVVELLEAAGPEFSVANDLATHPELGVAASAGISQNARAACQDIESVAAANGIEAELGCATIFP